MDTLDIVPQWPALGRYGGGRPKVGSWKESQAGSVLVGALDSEVGSGLQWRRSWMGPRVPSFAMAMMMTTGKFVMRQNPQN